MTAPHNIGLLGNRAFARWDTKTGTRSATFDLPGERGLLAGCLSPDGDTLSLMTCDPTEQRLGVFDANTGQARFPLQGHTGFVGGVSFSPDGRWLATGAQGNRVYLWELSRPPSAAFVLPARQLLGHTGQVWSVAFSPDGRVVASNSRDGTIRLWHVADGSEAQVLSAHFDSPSVLAFSPDGQTVAAVSDLPLGGDVLGPGLRLWDLGSKQERTFAGHTRHVRGLAFHPSGARVATGSFDGSVRLWETAPGAKACRVFEISPRSPVGGVAFTPSGRHFAVGLADGTIALVATPPAR